MYLFSKFEINKIILMKILIFFYKIAFISSHIIGLLYNESNKYDQDLDIKTDSYSIHSLHDKFDRNLNLNRKTH